MTRRKTLKLAPHIHSEFSDDSDWSLERLMTTLRRAGFDGALVCDHDRTMDDAKWDRLQAACDRIGERTGFLLVPGVEYQDPEHTVHVPVFGYGPFFGRSLPVDEILDSAYRSGGAAVFAHPARRDAWRAFPHERARDFAAVEVWNRKYDGVRPNAWALETAHRYGVPATVALDWHGPRQLFPLALRTPEPGSGTHRERAEAVVRQFVGGRVRATAFGAEVEQFSRGPLEVAGRAVEAARRRLAPVARRVEKTLRRSA